MCISKKSLFIRDFNIRCIHLKNWACKKTPFLIGAHRYQLTRIKYRLMPARYTKLQRVRLIVM